MKCVYLWLLTASLLTTGPKGRAQALRFTGDFAPSGSLVAPPERPFRDEQCLNGSWKFLPEKAAAALSEAQLRQPSLPQHPLWEKTPVKVPSPWNANSFAGRQQGGDFVTFPSYPQAWDTVRAGWLMRPFAVPASWKGQRLVLHFEAVAGFAQVYVNKKKVGENFDLFLPFEIDITDAVLPGAANELLLWVADAQLFNQPGQYGQRIHVGGSFWGQHAVGIWQDVFLQARPAVHIRDVFIQPFLDRNELVVEATVVNEGAAAQRLSLGGDIRPWVNQAGSTTLQAPAVKWVLGARVLGLPADTLELPGYGARTITLRVRPSGRLRLWSSEDPRLYGLVLQLNGAGGAVDRRYERFGWRQFSIKGDKFYLNGKPLLLKGDSWHFMGIPQMTRRYAWAWYTMLRQCHGNAVRLHAQPYPRFYLDMADEMGIYVLDETGIWASDGGPKSDADAYWNHCEDHLRRLVRRDRNHPAVFGWSVCNENLPVVMHVQRAPDTVIRRQVAEINHWVAITRGLDPTRDWISGDGETNLPTDLPVVLGHYGAESEIRNWSSQGKVWGIGEQGMAYSGTPRQVARFNGERAYASQQGRMEGLAEEAEQLLNLQKKYGATFSSIFNVVWYGLKPLALGMKDTTRTPRLTDGIYFGTYREGVPGVQPERLGPYTSTLNPGYDARLPLFEPWPLYEAVRRSFADSGPVAGREKPFEGTDTLLPKAAVDAVVLLSSDPDSVLSRVLSEGNIAWKEELKTTEKALLILDGHHPPADIVAAAKLQKTILENGGSVLVWGLDPQSQRAVNRLLSEPVELTSRQASSFVVKTRHPALQGLGPADFYFSERATEMPMRYGLEGTWVRRGTVLLDACTTEWKTWNHQPEYLKTAAVLRSEREKKPSGHALVARTIGKGTVYLMTLEPSVVQRTNRALLRRLFFNLGVNFSSTSRGVAALSPEGVLENALVLGAFDGGGKSVSDMGRVTHLQGGGPKSYDPARSFQNRFWEPVTARQGVLDLGRAGLMGPAENAVAYLSFWVYSPRSLTNLLIEPDMPRLDMLIGADDAFQVYLNDQLLKESLREGGLKRREQTIPALPLQKGWNHFVIKAIQKGGDWKVAVEFTCDQPAFLRELQSQLAPPL